MLLRRGGAAPASTSASASAHSPALGAVPTPTPPLHRHHRRAPPAPPPRARGGGGGRSSGGGSVPASEAPTYTSAADVMSHPGAGAHVLDPVWDVLRKASNGGGGSGGANGARATPSSPSPPSSRAASRAASAAGSSPTNTANTPAGRRAAATASAASAASSPIARKTKIVCTIGPATSSREAFFALADQGMDVVRLNMSHGSHSSHGEVIALAKEYNALVRSGRGGRSVLGLLLDTRGPEVRSGDLLEPLRLKPGDAVTFTRDPSANGRDHRIGVNYSDFPDDVDVGDELLVDGGIITFRVDEKSAETGDVRCTTVDGGELGSRRHLNVRGRSANLPALTEKDMEDLKFGLEAGVDYYALSFVRDAQVLRDVKAWLAKRGGQRVRVLAKIESADSVLRLDEILDAADGAMVARGDLGAELPVADVPFWQGKIIDGCRRRGKVCITATNMLESMVADRVPTRAEASDIAIAVREGSDAVMLSGETAYGRFPLRAVAVMASVASATEGAMARYSGARRFGTDEASPIDWVGVPLSVSGSSSSAAASGGRRGNAGNGNGDGNGNNGSAAALSELMAFHSVTIGDTAGVPLLVFSRSGGMPALLSHYRPHRPVFCFTDSPDVQQRLSLFHGVVPLYMPSLGSMPSIEEAIDAALAELLSRGLLQPKERVAIVQSGRRPIWRAPSTHVIQLRRAERRHARAARELRVARQLEAGAANLEAAAAVAAADEKARKAAGGAGGGGGGLGGGAGAVLGAAAGVAALSSFGGAGSSLNLDASDEDDDDDDDEDWDDEEGLLDEDGGFYGADD